MEGAGQGVVGSSEGRSPYGAKPLYSGEFRGAKPLCCGAAAGLRMVGRAGEVRGGRGGEQRVVRAAERSEGRGGGWGVGGSL